MMAKDRSILTPRKRLEGERGQILQEMNRLQNEAQIDKLGKVLREHLES